MRFLISFTVNPMKLVSWNINGIRAGLRNGLLDFIREKQPDCLFLQETKANLDQVDITELTNLGYSVYINPAVKKGYSGVGLISKSQYEVSFGIDNPYFDNEGRVLAIKIGDVKIFNIYFPSGSSGDLRQKYKYEFLDYLYTHLKNGDFKNVILCGDVNICHNEIDIHHPKQASRLGLSGFQDAERAWVTSFLDLGFVDAFRHVHPEVQKFTWWTYRQNAREKNLGWRIDYFFITKNLLEKVQDCVIYDTVLGSDHCPVELEIKI